MLGISTWMIQVTGDPGKMAAVQRNLSKFGIKELSRTGKVCYFTSKLSHTFLKAIMVLLILKQ